MRQTILFIIFTIHSSLLFGQNIRENFFSQVVDQFCECAFKAKNKSEFETCGSILALTDSVLLTEEDENYLFTKLKNKCGEAFIKYLGPQRSGIPPCSFLQQTDLKDFNLQKSKVDKVSVQWENEREDGIILGLIDARTLFSSEHLAQERIEEMNKVTMPDDFKKTIIRSNTFQSLEVINLGRLGDFSLYQLWARRDTMVYFLTISLLKEDFKTIEIIIDKLSYRVENCN